jgi:hypothetical protein
MSNFKKRLMAGAGLILSLLWGMPDLASQKPDELQQVMDRAARYVADYEENQLGILLVNEVYLQNAVYYSADGRGLIRGTEKRQTEADFLMIADDGDRVGIRQVRTVNGTPVPRKDNLETMLEDTPAAMHKRLIELRQDSSSYNIGGVLRKINVPTFALRVARAKESQRFSFEKHSVKNSRNGEVWEVRFKELTPPTLSRGLKDEPLFSTGTLWIEAMSGRILKTRFYIKNPYSQPSATGETEVTYVQDKSLDMLVPSKMTERYETVLSIVTTDADYSKYRKFNVEASAAPVSTRP